jgi:hypothetical protein
MTRQTRVVGRPISHKIAGVFFHGDDSGYR